MKKLVYKLLVIIFFISLNGCDGFWMLIGTLMYGGDYEGIPFLADQNGNELYGILVGEGGTIFTSDGVGPVEWLERQSGTSETLNFVKTCQLTIIPDAFSIGDAGTILYSSDKGHNWEDRRVPSLVQNLYGCTFFESATDPGIAVCGESGIVCISTNAGLNWSQHNTITTNRLTSLISYGGDNFVAVGENGTIIKGGPGFGWENKSIDPNVHLNRIFAGIDQSWSKLWAVGTGGKIYYSSNYGIDWSTQNSGVTEELYDVKFRSSDEGMIVGAGGVVRYTTNGGLNWLSDPYFDGLTDGDIYSLSVVDTNTANAIVHNATERAGGTLIFSVSTEPFTDVEDDGNTKLSAFHLDQNYPNPFNPSTKINYEIPYQGIVSLKIYDVLGNEIATLVNEEKSAGTYEVTFDGSGFSGGIYFYQLNAGNEFLETKKLVLLK